MKKAQTKQEDVDLVQQLRAAHMEANESNSDELTSLITRIMRKEQNLIRTWMHHLYRFNTRK